MTKSRRILIIEDDQKVRKEIKRAFTMDDEFDFKVAEASIVKEAIEILKKERRFDLLVIDWRLGPVKDGGLELLNNLDPIKIYHPKIKIVYTAYATLEDSVKAIRAGADDYIDKNQEGSLKKLLDSAKQKLRDRKFEEHEPDSEWLSEHIEELMDQYSGELIAFIDGEVIDHAPTMKKLKDKVKKAHPNEEPYIMFAPMEVI